MPLGYGRRGKWLGFALSFFIGALVIGALKPTNTWDYYTFLLLNLFILGYCGWKYLKPPGSSIKNGWPGCCRLPG
jgi:hypothetical protein